MFMYKIMFIYIYIQIVFIVTMIYLNRMNMRHIEIMWHKREGILLEERNKNIDLNTMTAESFQQNYNFNT